MNEYPSQASCDSMTLRGRADVTITKSSVFHALEKFPDRAGEIKRLYKENQDFQIICEDYLNVPRRCTIGINRIEKRR